MLPAALRRLLVGALLLAAACRAAPAPATPVAYANPAKGLAFTYPSDWEVIDVETDASITLLTDAALSGANPDTFGSGDALMVLGVEALPLVTYGWEPLQFVIAMTNQFAAGAELEILDEPEVRTLGGRSFALTAFRAHSLDTPGAASVVFLASHMTKELSLLVLGETSSDGAEDFRPVFESVLTSLTLSLPAER